ncbi:MAG: hypothetical protein Q8Q78_10545 [Hydrogenophaga sp.]|nr:hypothetical protein [Hydrogenophaga sp.]
MDPLLTELLDALRRADTSSLVLALCDEILAKANRDALRKLIGERLHQLVPVATEPTAGLICHLLGVMVEPVFFAGKARWKLPSALADTYPHDFASAPAAYQAAVLLRFPRQEWEAKVDLGVVRTRYWAWALLQAMDSLGETP